jgi:hypothetical protein
MEWCFSTTKLLTEGWGWEGAVESSFERCFDPELLFFFVVGGWRVVGGWVGRIEKSREMLRWQVASAEMALTRGQWKKLG